MVDLPRPDPLVLQVIGDQRREIGRRLPQQGEPRRERLLGVRVRPAVEVRGHRFRIAEVRLGLGDARREQEIVVVDEAGVLVAVDGAAQGQPAGDERQVERHAGVAAGGAAVREAEQVAADLQRAALRVGAPRQVAHRPGQGAGAVERPLRSEQHLHPLDVVQPEVDGERDVAEVGGDAVVVVVAGRLRPVEGVGVQPAHDDHVAAARALIDDGQPRRPAGQLREVVDRAALDVRAGHGGDAHRHLPERLLDAGRGHHRGIRERRQPQRDGRQRDRRGADRDAVQPHLSEAAQGHRHHVRAGGEAVEGEPALRIRLPLPEPARPASQHDRRAGQDGAGGVDNDPRECPGLGRGGRPGRRANGQQNDAGRRSKRAHGCDCACRTPVSVKPAGAGNGPRGRLVGRPRPGRRGQVARPVPRRIRSRRRGRLPAAGGRVARRIGNEPRPAAPPRLLRAGPSADRTTWHERSRDGV